MNKSAQILLYRIILGCPLLLVAPEHALAAPSDPDWKEFQIPDLGTRVDYPAAVFSVSDGKSEVGMGERLSTADRRASPRGPPSGNCCGIGDPKRDPPNVGSSLSGAFSFRVLLCPGLRRSKQRPDLPNLCSHGPAHRPDPMLEIAVAVALRTARPSCPTMHSSGT